MTIKKEKTKPIKPGRLRRGYDEHADKEYADQTTDRDLKRRFLRGEEDPKELNFED